MRASRCFICHDEITTSAALGELGLMYTEPRNRPGPGWRELQEDEFDTGGGKWASAMRIAVDRTKRRWIVFASVLAKKSSLAVILSALCGSMVASFLMWAHLAVIENDKLVQQSNSKGIAKPIPLPTSLVKNAVSEGGTSEAEKFEQEGLMRLTQAATGPHENFAVQDIKLSIPLKIEALSHYLYASTDVLKVDIGNGAGRLISGRVKATAKYVVDGKDVIVGCCGGAARHLFKDTSVGFSAKYRVQKFFEIARPVGQDVRLSGAMLTFETSLNPNPVSTEWLASRPNKIVTKTRPIESSKPPRPQVANVRQESSTVKTSELAKIDPHSMSMDVDESSEGDEIIDYEGDTTILGFSSTMGLSDRVAPALRADDSPEAVPIKIAK